jgi:hypothetical protein
VRFKFFAKGTAMQNDQFSTDNKAWNKGNDPEKFPVNPNDVKDNRKPHAVVMDSDTLAASGKEVSSVNNDIKSVHPSTGSTSDSDYQIIDNANIYPNIKDEDFKYPFNKLEAKQSVFIPVEPGNTIDKLMADLHHQIEIFRRNTADIEKDEKGDNISEMIITHTKKRNADGTIQLNDGDKPIEGANQTIRPKYIYARNFIVRALIKDEEIVKDGQKAESDGALLTRVF